MEKRIFVDEFIDAVYLAGTKENGEYNLTLSQAEDAAHNLYIKAFPQKQNIQNEISPYQCAINNCKHYLKTMSSADRNNPEMLNAFDLSAALSVAFCKTKEEILMDFVR